MEESSNRVLDNIEAFVDEMTVNKMYGLPNSRYFKWAMIEHNKYGYCWTMGYKGLCTTIYSKNASENIKYWTTEEDAKIDLVRMISENR